MIRDSTGGGSTDDSGPNVAIRGSRFEFVRPYAGGLVTLVLMGV